jgi:hypothetical protein
MISPTHVIAPGKAIFFKWSIVDNKSDVPAVQYSEYNNV